MQAESLRQTGVSLFLGAGASMDMGFPSGRQLKGEIARKLATDSEARLRRVVATHFGDDLVREFVEALHLAENADRSIDAILERERQFSEVARVAVWWTILGHEQKCAAELKSTLRKIEDYWFYRFLTRYFAGCKRPQDLWNIGHLSRGLVVNTLNYDRLAEATFVNWIERNIPDSDEHVEALVQHKHGLLQRLCDLEFGAGFPPEGEVLERAKHLVFWFEKSRRPENWDRTNVPIQLRGTFAVLGFGYHEDIVSRFEASSMREVGLRRIVATATGITDDEERVKIADTLSTRFSTNRLSLELLPASQGCSEAVDGLFAV
jgi:hypothetical protein